VDDLSRASAVKARSVKSLQPLRFALRDVVEQAGWPALSLDVFATAENALTSRFFSASTVPHAEAMDAMVQPDWNSRIFTVGASRSGLRLPPLDINFAQRCARSGLTGAAASSWRRLPSRSPSINHSYEHRCSRGPRRGGTCVAPQTTSVHRPRR
jgi:hypothetical protein